MTPGASGDMFRDTAPEGFIDLGDLYVPTGRIYCCDPFLTDEVGPLEREVEPGSYRVRLALRTIAYWGRRVGAAALEIRDGRPTRWEVASYRSENGRSGSQFVVDAGLACFMDASTRDAFVAVLDRFYESAGAEENYYDQVLAEEFSKSADPGRRGHAGDWAMHHPIPGDPRNLAIFASGLGDGVYAAAWGLDTEDNPVALSVDFGVTDFGRE